VQHNYLHSYNILTYQHHFLLHLPNLSANQHLLLLQNLHPHLLSAPESTILLSTQNYSSPLERHLQHLIISSSMVYILTIENAIAFYIVLTIQDYFLFFKWTYFTLVLIVTRWKNKKTIVRLHQNKGHAILKR
jgi:hypothetical protein